MLNPGGTPGTAFTESATTRFNNNQTNAVRATMPGNLAAQASLRNQYSKQNPGSPVGVQQTAPNAPQLPVMSAPVPTGEPALPVQQEAGFDPSVFAESALDQIIGEVRTQKFIESPRVKDAMESIRLKNIMNSKNPKYIPDSRPLFQQLVTKMGMDK